MARLEYTYILRSLVRTSTYQAGRAQSCTCSVVLTSIPRWNWWKSTYSYSNLHASIYDVRRYKYAYYCLRGWISSYRTITRARERRDTGSSLVGPACGSVEHGMTPRYFEVVPTSVTSHISHLNFFFRFLQRSTPRMHQASGPCQPCHLAHGSSTQRDLASPNLRSLDSSIPHRRIIGPLQSPDLTSVSSCVVHRPRLQGADHPSESSASRQ